LIQQQVDIVEWDEIKLIGYSITESLNSVLSSGSVGRLREELEKRKAEIAGYNGTGIYLLQIYPEDGCWTPDVPYLHVVGVKAAAHDDEIPDGMAAFSIAAGRYMKVVHSGKESKIGETYDFINSTYGVRPIDIEYWSDIGSLDQDDSRIEIYFPTSR
jgi:predicted transcriptional regulator YdeE